MSLKSFYEKEKYVAIHGQSRQFRIRKYIIIFIISFLVYQCRGWAAVGYLLAIGAIAGVCFHFYFRWKTQGWTKSWGLYKKII